jgi:hypothetical protein
MIILSLGTIASGTASATTTWTGQTLPGTASGQEIGAISCPTTSFCMAVVNHSDTGTVSAEEWNGSSWTAVTMANPSDPSPTADAYDLSGVSCTSAKFCMAVGGVEGDIELHTLAEVWDGTSWKVTSAPAAGAEPYLSSVSCLTADDCVTAGSYIVSGGSDASAALAEQWNGASWKRILHSSTHNTGLNSISCPSARLCFAGGSLLSGLEQWNGSTWKLVGRGVVSSRDISCTSTTNCLAIGCSWASTCLNLGPQNSFAWNGTRWDRVTNNGAKRQNLLYSLSCVSATSCTAVGGLQGSTVAVAGTWNGHDWTLQRDPSGTAELQLAVVACAKTSCEAGGAIKSDDGLTPTAIGHA